MRVKIRLYRPHDMDLIALKRSESYKLGTEIKRCLIAYAAGEEYIPPEFSFSDNKDGYVGKYYQMHIELNPKKLEEKNAIDILSQIKPGYRCVFLKTLFRSSCPYLPLLVFAEDNGIATSKLEAYIQKNERKNAPKEDSDETSVLKPVEAEIKESKRVVPETVPAQKEAPVQVEPAIQTASTTDSNDLDALFAEFSKMGA